MSSNGSPFITERQFEVLAALKKATGDPKGPGYNSNDSQRGWFLASQLTDKKLLSGNDVRAALLSLCNVGLAERKQLESGQYFRLTRSGDRKVEEGFRDDQIQVIVDSTSWTGVIERPKVYQALAILNEMEDACEKIKNNHDRAQIFGLIRALDVLLNIPDPPRQGVVGLIRDPAFANIIQVATFLAALIGAVRP